MNRRRAENKTQLEVHGMASSGNDMGRKRREQCYRKELEETLGETVHWRWEFVTQLGSFV